MAISVFKKTPLIAAVPMTALPLVNGWVNYLDGGWQTAFYLRDSLGWVEVGGLIKSGVFGTAVTVGNLPAGFRPPANRGFVTSVRYSAGGNTEIRMNVLPTGAINIDVPPSGATNDFLFLDGIRFLAAL